MHSNETGPLKHRGKLLVADLFSGIGGFSLGFERTGGFVTTSFCEINSYCRRVLAKHWPDVPCFEDIRQIQGKDIGKADVICGGFPCQDISVAGRGMGLEGERSGLFFEIIRLAREVRPRFLVLENVAALKAKGRGFDRVLQELAAIGYDVEWHCIPAAALGAPHRRDRIWIVAHTNGAEWWSHAASRRRMERKLGVPQGEEGPGRFGECCQVVPDADRNREHDGALVPEGAFTSQSMGNPDGARLAFRQIITKDHVEKLATTVGAGWWQFEPDVGRVANGVPARMDRLSGLGNAIVPLIAEMIGNAILGVVQAEEQHFERPAGY